jgi:hypothetical protein
MLIPNSCYQYTPSCKGKVKSGIEEFDSPPETVLKTLDFLENQYAGVIGYLQAIGITAEQINQLRGMLVD